MLLYVSKLDYCNAVLAGVSGNHFERTGLYQQHSAATVLGKVAAPHAWNALPAAVRAATY